MMRGAGPMAKDAMDKELAEACMEGDAQRVYALLMQGASPNAEFPAGEVGGIGEGMETVLGLALRQGHFGVAEMLLRHGARAQGNGDPRTFDPLHYAAASPEQRSVATAYILMQNGADPNGVALGKTPLFCVRLAAMADMLIRHGANVNARNDAWAEGTPLHIAAQSGNAEVARVLLQHGANANARDCDGHTPLYWARDYGCAEVAELLEAYGGKAL